MLIQVGSAMLGYHVLEPSWKGLGMFNQRKTKGSHGGCLQIWRYFLNRIENLYLFHGLDKKQRIKESARKQSQFNTKEIKKSYWWMVLWEALEGNDHYFSPVVEIKLNHWPLPMLLPLKSLSLCKIFPFLFVLDLPAPYTASGSCGC